MDTKLIDQKLAELKQARKANEFHKSEMKAVVERAKKSERYLESEIIARESGDTITVLEAELRGLALDEYEATKNKTPHPKIAVKIFKTFKILDAAKVRAWAFGNLPAALKLDEKKVEKYALEFGDVEGTKKGEEARAQIATEL